MQIRLWLVVLAVSAMPAFADPIDLTRYLATFEADAPALTRHTFMGVPGTAQLLVDGDTERLASLTLNGGPLVTRTASISLAADNTLEVRLRDTPGRVGIRVKQNADVELHVESRIHFNTNVSNFEAARAFYGKLGFETLSGFPDTNTLEMAQAIGIDTPTEYDGSQGEAAGGYLLHGELIGVNGNSGGLIDLIEFTIPRRETPPYANINHLGMASAAMLTADLDADMASMREAGITFVGPAATGADGRRFAVFKDLDGTFYELIEAEGEPDADSPTNIFALGHVRINVSDFERSAAWYRMLGFELTTMLPEQESAAVGQAFGFSGPISVRAGRFTHPIDGSELLIAQWLTPYDADPPYTVPVNHFGIHRMAFTSTDIEADVAQLKAQGVTFVSPITPCCSGPDSWGGIVAFYDPDGTVMEFADQPLMNIMMRILRWFS